MEVLLIHNILQAQFRDDLKDLLSKEYKFKEDKDIRYSFLKYFGFKGKVKSIKSLHKKINDIIEDNYDFDKYDKMLLYFVDNKDKNTPKLRKKRLV